MTLYNVKIRRFLQALANGMKELNEGIAEIIKELK